MPSYTASPGSFMPNDVESSLLLDECQCHVALSAVVLHRVNPSFLGSSCPMHISVKCQFRISGMIHSLHMTKILHSLLLYPICYVLSRPTLSYTSLFLILSLLVTPAILLKQDISNTHNLFSCVCFKVQVSELCINTLSTIVSYTFNFVVLSVTLTWNLEEIMPFAEEFGRDVI